jgi:hypothetical protein
MALQVWLVNVAESNPCKVNGAASSTGVHLKSGDTIAIGGREFFFCVDATEQNANSNKRSAKTRKSKSACASPYRAALENVVAGACAEDAAEKQKNVDSEEACRGPDDLVVAVTDTSSAPEDIESPSSPVGSKLLQRKIKMQMLAKQANNNMEADTNNETSSPVGSKLLQRKIRLQMLAKQARNMEEVSACACKVCK